MSSKHGSQFGVVADVPQTLGEVGSQGRRFLWATQRLERTLRTWGVVLILTFLALEVGGCASWFRPVGWDNLETEGRVQQSPFKVVPRKIPQVAALSPDDIVRIMQRVGFQDEQILELGTDLHNALRFSGAATVVYKKETLAIFSADGDYVRIRSRSGSFDYQISKGQFVVSSSRSR